MKTFADNAGRTWTVGLNVDAIRRVRAARQVNLLAAVEGELLEQLATDPVLLCDLLYVLCQAEAESRGVSDADFGRAMAGDALEHATTALLEELVDFFPSGKRRVLHQALAKLRAVEARALEVAQARLNDPELDRQIAAALSAPIAPSSSSPPSPG